MSGTKGLHVEVPTAARVLIADDDDDIRGLLASRVTQWGYAVSTARDGAEALRLAREQPFDLAILDISMPELDGLAVTAALRNDLVTRLLPILLLTSRDSDGDVAAGFHAGADDYLKKPFQPLEVRARVEAALSRRQAARVLEDLRDAIAPREPTTHPALEIAVSCQPTAGAAAGGDFYGVVNAPGGRLVAFLGDALGHGPAAAGLAAHTRSVLVNHASHDASPQRLLELTNAALTNYHAADDFVFVSVACLTLHPELGTIEWALAGHPPPFLLPGSGTRPLASPRPGPPLGLEIAPEYPTAHALLGSGDSLLLVSDGLLETRNGTEQFADRALADALSSAGGLHPQALIQALLDARDRFAPAPAIDDVCLMAVRTTVHWGSDPHLTPGKAQ